MPSKMPGQWRVFRFERADGNYCELASNHLAPEEIALPAGYAFVKATPMVDAAEVDRLRDALVGVRRHITTSGGLPRPGMHAPLTLIHEALKPRETPDA